ncbi:hypothetical protein ABTX61_08715 [Amycolatopsis japonica]|uniref:hypothetical protein n=1 Tax=Amycolatopsis japonica TaxID=208439 RepID=UPI0033172354
MWTCGPDPIDAHAVWPVPIVEAITTAFTDTDAHVVLVDLDPAPATATMPLDIDGVTTDSAASVTAAREAVHAIGRTADTVTFHSGDGGSAALSRPFWAGLVSAADDPSAALAGTPSVPDGTDAPCSAEGHAPERGTRADLVIVSLPDDAASVPLDRLVLLAANRLRQGGILAVYTHSDWTRGRLVDPTGVIVAAAQHADLLYLQHIVTLHAPVEKGRLRAAPSAAAVAEYGRARQRATVRGLPVPHLRVHGDVLAFAQPADVGAPPPSEPAPVTAAPGAGGRQ